MKSSACITTIVRAAGLGLCKTDENVSGVLLCLSPWSAALLQTFAKVFKLVCLLRSDYTLTVNCPAFGVLVMASEKNLADTGDVEAHVRDIQRGNTIGDSSVLEQDEREIRRMGKFSQYKVGQKVFVLHVSPGFADS